MEIRGKISVCIATYNGKSYVVQQIRSILPQLKEEDEIIISDDHSTDATLTILESFKDRRIKIYMNPHKGILSNFENALQHATGEYFFLCDQDDIWKDNKVEEVMKNLTGGYDLVLSDCTLFERNITNIREPSFFQLNRSRAGVLYNIWKNSYMGCCMAFNNKVKAAVLPFPKKIPMHDQWIGIIAELFFKVKFSEKKLIYYRVHNSNATSSGAGKSRYKLAKKILFRLQLIKVLLKYVFKRNVHEIFHS
ncbi:MAG: glycosyltransferase family 2 protein [Niabella sp.]